METCGYFGKIPSAKDFLFQGLPMRITERWAGHMAEWLARGNKAHPADWQQHMLRSPVWRFALDKDIVSAEAWIGLLAGSIDGAGRLFPFTTMMQVDVDLARHQPFDAIDRLLDGLEPCFLDFMQGDIEKPALMAALVSTTRALGQGPALPGAVSLLLPTDTDRALCRVGTRSSQTPVFVAAPRNVAPAGDGTGLTAWWHGGTSSAEPALCVSRGLLPAPISVALFDGDWLRHGWDRR
jgi:type VI secretion system protein ImpM